MSIEIGAKVGNLSLGATLVSPRQQKNDAATATQELTGDVIRDAAKPSQLLQVGPLEQLLNTPSPLDRLSETRK
ncbi:hypothetical protein [Sphingomonas sp. LM7]|uniref:hypothetical protein n=1 Tax=Sphingomonas sp. LM7 TaxID=1938607 RepID=UPI000983F53A|nr:hypothetical protein [Sphingomonas sp. LM7]AQR73337.1 hypothetical protein BXU08_06475 [Sphingomonas sp. LM7]